MNKHMDSELLDLAGKTIVYRVRDEVISSIDKAMRGAKLDIYSKKIHSLTQHLDSESKKVIYELIPYIVGGAIEMFFQMVDHGNEADLRLVSVKNGVFLIPEICFEAEYSFSEGWAKRFSQERESNIRKEAEGESHTLYKPSLSKKIPN